MTEPLVPAEVDLTDFPYMPLDVQRLRDSDLASECSPEACWAAVLLWCASWHQVPAGSIPDSELWQAKHAGYLARGKIDKGWNDVKDDALRNWIKCSDGRLYHPVVAEKALTAWKEKLAQRARTKAATEAREAKRRAASDERNDSRDDERDDSRHDERHEERDDQRDVLRNDERDVHQEKGEGREGNRERPPQPPRGDWPGFSDFYSPYPKKEARPKALQAWNKLRPDAALIARIVADVRKRAASFDWKKDGGRYVPQPATYLNQARWEDQPQSAPPAQTTLPAMNGQHPEPMVERSFSGDEIAAMVGE